MPVALLALVRVEVRIPSPLIRVQIFRHRAFVVDNVVLFFSMIAFVPVFFFASVYSQVSLHYKPSKAGLYLLIFFAGFAPAAQVGGRMLDSGGARRSVILGSAVATAGVGLLLGTASTARHRLVWALAHPGGRPGVDGT